MTPISQDGQPSTQQREKQETEIKRPPSGGGQSPDKKLDTKMKMDMHIKSIIKHCQSLVIGFLFFVTKSLKLSYGI